MDNIPLYGPTGAVAKRLYNFLMKVQETYTDMYVRREQLYAIAAKNNIQRNEVYGALKELERVVNCIFFWDSKEQTVFYLVADWSPEEKIKRIEDAVWFEQL